MIQFAGIKILDCTPEILAKFPGARQKISVVEVKHLKLGTPGLGYFKPTSEDDFSDSDTYRFCDVESRKLPLCYVVALGVSADAVREKLKQRRHHVPNRKFGADNSGFHTGTDSKNGSSNPAKAAERKVRRDAKRALVDANLSNMQSLMADSDNWLAPSQDKEGSPRPRSISLDSGKRKTPDHEGPGAPGRKRSLSNDRISSDASFLVDTLEGIKKSFEEQCCVFNKELEEERALRRQAQQELADLRKAWRAEAQENKKDRDDLMGVIIALKSRTLSKQMGKSPADNRSIVEQMDEMYPNSVCFEAPKPSTQPQPVCLGIVDKNTNAKLHCNAANYRDAFNASKPIEWAKHMLLGIYGSEAKLMRYHSPRTEDKELRKIPEGEYLLLSDAYDKWLTEVLHLQKNTPVYVSFSKSLGSTIGSAGRSLYVSPRTGNGTKLSSSSRKKKEVYDSDRKLSVTSEPRSGLRTPPPNNSSEGDLLKGGARAFIARVAAQLTSSTQNSNSRPHDDDVCDESTIDGALDLDNVSQTEALKMLGALNYPPRKDENLAGSVSEHSDSDVTDFDGDISDS